MKWPSQGELGKLLLTKEPKKGEEYSEDDQTMREIVYGEDI